MINSKMCSIVVPHGDDEVIGCHTLLKTGMVSQLLFLNSNQFFDSKCSCDYYGVSRELIDADFLIKNQNNLGILLFPDPVYELHPEHRRLGALGEQILRTGESRVIFYSTNMNAPYIREIGDWKEKRNALNTLYPEKSELWKYDHKYFLFEGQIEWRMRWQDL